MNTSSARKDFSPATLRALAAKGISILSTTWLPGEGDMPYANGERGYNLDDNGTHRVRTFRQVLILAS